MMMGLADLVPGVSGGTIALIAGIYQELIETLNKLRPSLLKTLFQKGPAAFWSAINGPFLLCVFGGILSSVFLFSSLIQWMLIHKQILLFAFFFGVLIASLLILRKHVSQWNLPHLLLLLGGALIAFVTTQLVPTHTEIDSAYLFFCGFLAISAMILPGLSGAYLLLVLGAYGRILQLVQDAIQVLTEFAWTDFFTVYGALSLFVLGIITGLLTFSRILRWFLKNYPSKTLASLLGLMLGALHKIWPWQLIRETSFQGKTRQFYTAVWPHQYPGDPEWLMAATACILGIGTLFALEHFKKRQSLV